MQRCGTQQPRGCQCRKAGADGVIAGARRRKGHRAIEIAEAAVTANPQDAAYRTVLGRAYLLGGRFDSAKAAFTDALTLGSKDVRTIVNLALIHTAQGHGAQAQALITDHMNVLPAADYGLAMAMAGDADEAVRVLSQAIHDPAAGAKERQNLAYSYALAGRWTEARQRVLGWAQFAQPGAESQRVIAMMGVQPRADDAGLPVRLALVAPTLETPIRTAEGDNRETAPVAQENAPVELAVVDTAPQPGAAMPAPAATPLLRAKPAMVAKTDVPASRSAGKWSPVDPARGSAWVVQIGAFSSSAAARAGWLRYVRRNAALAEFPMIHSSAKVHGQDYHRIAVAGFGDRGGANQLCASLRANGGNCFVRMGGQEASPARWVLARKPQQVAMR
jgi:cell division septation protein DedD